MSATSSRFIRVGGATYRPAETITWEIGLLGSGWALTIPETFRFDSSVPSFLHWLVSPHHEAWLLAAAVHDRLLALGHDKAFAAGEWFRAARAMAKTDTKRWLVLPAYYGVVLWTVR
jgi:hypothetical protein